MKGSKRTSPAETERELSKDELCALVDEATRNPWKWYPLWICAAMMGFGMNVMTVISRMEGAPIMFRKANPHELHRWMIRNRKTLRQAKAR